MAAFDMGCYEVVHPTADTDGDEMPDNWEIANALSPIVWNAEDDDDHDAMDNLSEYGADTHPHNRNSSLGFLDVQRDATAPRVYWQGGVDFVQVLEYCTNAAAASPQWVMVLSNHPPTRASNSFEHAPALPDGAVLYRVRAHR